MVMGGNAKLMKFYEQYKLPKSPVDLKYKTVAGKYYREMVSDLSTSINNQHNSIAVLPG